MSDAKTLTPIAGKLQQKLDHALTRHQDPEYSALAVVDAVAALERNLTDLQRQIGELQARPLPQWPALPTNAEDVTEFGPNAERILDRAEPKAEPQFAPKEMARIEAALTDEQVNDAFRKAGEDRLRAARASHGLPCNCRDVYPGESELPAELCPRHPVKAEPQPAERGESPKAWTKVEVEAARQERDQLRAENERLRKERDAKAKWILELKEQRDAARDERDFLRGSHTDSLLGRCKQAEKERDAARAESERRSKFLKQWESAGAIWSTYRHIGEAPDTAAQRICEWAQQQEKRAEAAEARVRELTTELDTLQGKLGRE